MNTVSFAFAVLSFLLIESLALGLNLQLLFVSLLLVLSPNSLLSLVSLFLRFSVIFCFGLEIKLTVLTGKIQYFSTIHSIQYKNDCLAASDLYHMFTQSIKFYNMRLQMFEKCDL